MKVHEILQQNTDLLRALARAGAAIEDVRYIPCGTTTNGFAVTGSK